MLPISLGRTCQVRFQLLRWVYAQRFPLRSLDDFRHGLFSKSKDVHVLPRFPFDWHTTTTASICEWLERDFHGVFDLADLAPSPTGVVNTRFRARFPHHFHSDDIAAEYPVARAKIDAAADRFRSLKSRAVTFFLYDWEPCEQTHLRLREALRRYSDGQVVIVPEIVADKPAEQAWEGCDEWWTKLLDEHLDYTAVSDELLVT
jgi:hypothetical protein